MVYKRFENSENVDISILGDLITFPNKKTIAKNRFLKSAMTERLAEYKPGDKNNGIPTENLVNLYEKFGVGGYGVILTGNIQIDENYIEGIGNMIIDENFDSDERKVMFSRVADAAKREGSLIVVQLGHAGNMTPDHVNSKPLSVSNVEAFPSPKPWKSFGVPIVIEKDKIKDIINKYVYSALYCYNCGFNGIEIHAAYGFFLACFLSKYFNTRDDEYGGDIKNRSRIIFQIFKAIREKIPNESGFLIGIKISTSDFKDKNNDPSEFLEFIKLLDEEGFDFIEITGGCYEKPPSKGTEGNENERESFHELILEMIKDNVKNSIVYLSGGFRTACGMVSAIKGKYGHGISLGRPATAEVDLPKKILQKNVSSCAWYDFYNFSRTESGAGAQMFQMSKKSLKESKNNAMEGVVDLSDPETLKKFSSDYNKFAGSLIKSFKEGKPMNDLFMWEP